MKPAFSTVACPHLTLTEVAAAAVSWGFECVELRTFGPDSRDFAGDPTMSAPAKVRAIFDERGVEIASLATSARFDAPLNPPVLGHLIGDQERSVRECKRAIDLAAAIGCPIVRVFGFEAPAWESRTSAVARIASRLKSVVDHARNTGVKVAVENGGSFQTADELASLIDSVGSNLLGAFLNVHGIAMAGGNAAKAVRTLGSRVFAVRLKDGIQSVLTPLSEKSRPCREAVQALVESGFDGPAVIEWDRAWIQGLAPPEEVLPSSAKVLFGWLGTGSGVASPDVHAGVR